MRGLAKIRMTHMDTIQRAKRCRVTGFEDQSTRMVELCRQLARKNENGVLYRNVHDLFIK